MSRRASVLRKRACTAACPDFEFQWLCTRTSNPFLKARSSPAGSVAPLGRGPKSKPATSMALPRPCSPQPARVTFHAPAREGAEIDERERRAPVDLGGHGRDHALELLEALLELGDHSWRGGESGGRHPCSRRGRARGSQTGFRGELPREGVEPIDRLALGRGHRGGVEREGSEGRAEEQESASRHASENAGAPSRAQRRRTRV